MISKEQRNTLREEASNAEQRIALTEAQLAIIHEAGWFKMFLPSSMGGLGLTLPEGLRLEESLARIDGSLGWTITLCSGATMFAGFLEPTLAAELLDDPRVCFGGSGAPHGIAEITDDGFVINGRWKYATGAPHLTAFTANCQIAKGGEIQLDDNGQPLVRAFVLLPDEVQLEEDWETMGLIATAGHAFTLNDLYVSSDRAFDIKPEAARVSDPLLQYPFIPFAELTLAVNSLGMAQHFLDLCSENFAHKPEHQQEKYTALLSQGQTKLDALRSEFYAIADPSWDELVNTGHCSDETLKSVNATSVELVWSSRQIVVDLFPYCGMAATNTGTEINRVWRDLFTASQHSKLNRPGVQVSHPERS